MRAKVTNEDETRGNKMILGHGLKQAKDKPLVNTEAGVQKKRGATPM